MRISVHEKNEFLRNNIKVTNETAGPCENLSFVKKGQFCHRVINIRSATTTHSLYVNYTLWYNDTLPLCEL